MLSPNTNISTLPFFSQQSLNRNKNSFSFLLGYIFPQLTFLLTKNSLTLKVSSTNFSKYLNLIKKNCSLYILKGLLKVIKSYYVTRVGKKEDDQKETLKLTIILQLLEWWKKLAKVSKSFKISIQIHLIIESSSHDPSNLSTLFPSSVQRKKRKSPLSPVQTTSTPPDSPFTVRGKYIAASTGSSGRVFPPVKRTYANLRTRRKDSKGMNGKISPLVFLYIWRLAIPGL